MSFQRTGWLNGDRIALTLIYLFYGAVICVFSYWHVLEADQIDDKCKSSSTGKEHIK